MARQVYIPGVGFVDLPDEGREVNVGGAQVQQDEAAAGAIYHPYYHHLLQGEDL